MKPRSPPLQSIRLLDQVRERIRYLHYSLATEKVYLYWVRFFVRWHGRYGTMTHSRDMGAPQVQAFLTMLATERKVSSSTHNQALSALLFLYREVLDIDLPWLNDINRPARTRRIPCVLTKAEVASLLGVMDGETSLLARLLYGTGMRLMEGMRLRIKDVEFDRYVISVREAKGNKDRVVMLPLSLAPALRLQMLSLSLATWEADRQAQRAGVQVPDALEVKYPRLGQRWGWFWMFPAPKPSVDPRSGVERRHHLFEERLQRSLLLQSGTARPLLAANTRKTSPSTMPIYAYKCESCGFAKDVLQKMSDAPLSVCPQCSASSFKKQLTAAGFQLKGSGWYATDFRGGNSGAPAAKPAETQAAGSGDAGKTSSSDAGAGSASAASPAATPSAPASTAPSSSTHTTSSGAPTKSS